MGDDDGGAALSGSIQSSLHNTLAVDVQCTSGFIEDQDLGLTNDGSRDSNSLTLATTELETLSTYAGMVALFSLG